MAATSSTAGGSGQSTIAAAPHSGPAGQGSYVVQPGDCLSSIAREYGHFWQRIWDDPANNQLRSARHDPNVLMPGDLLAIPEKTAKEVPGQTELRHRFVRKGEPAFLPIQVLENDRPLANKPYRLTVDGRLFTGNTDDEGKLRLRIAGNAREAVLVVGNEPDEREYRLALGGVDPLDCIRGIQQRLINLGFEEVAVTGELDQVTRQALAAFQAANALPETGEDDEQTRARIREKHGH